MKTHYQRTTSAAESVSTTEKKRVRAFNDRNIFQVMNFNLEIPIHARKDFQQKSKTNSDMMKNSENYRVNFKKLALAGTYNRYRQFTINRIFKLSCGSNKRNNQVTVVRITKLERQIRSKLQQKDMLNMSQSAKKLLVNSEFKISPKSMIDPRVSTGPKRKRMTGPSSYRKINDFQITELNSIRISTYDSSLIDIKTLKNLFRSRKLKIMRYQELTSGSSFLDHCPHSMKYTNSFYTRRALVPGPKWNLLELITPKHLAFESNHFILPPRVIIESLSTKLSLLEVFKALRCLVSISLIKNNSECIKCTENNPSLIKPWAFLEILDSVTDFEKSDLSIVFKEFIPILEVRLKDSLNLSKKFGCLINGYSANLNLNLYAGDTEVLLYFKKRHRSLKPLKDRSILSSLGDLKGYDSSLHRTFTVDKSASPTNQIQFAFNTHNKLLSNDDDDDDRSVKYIDEEKKKTTKNSKVKKQVKRASAKSPYFSSSKKYCKEKVLNLPTKLCRQFLSFSSHLKISNTVPTPSGEISRKHSCRGAISCIPFPPLSESYFGLIQEKLADNPFRLLIAITFLIRTHGKQAIPIYHMLINRYPTPESFVAADMQEIVSMITCLGFQNQRANTCKLYATIWLQDPPLKGRRYAVRDYPVRGSGRDIKKGEVLTDSDTRDAWEIGHMTSGPYALDSWRIFCRDKLRRVAIGWNGEGAREGFQPEWMRVVPKDKELRAFLQWMWLKEGFLWNPKTGEKEVAGTELMIGAQEGKILWDDINGLRVTT
ncbi:hypothetical protein EPUL_001137 [Erysiphe pulchra]|uniref:HhH-GPD domain-containing protein n=1 Tax=Erysiphe pulchra TaxID=225359 RepID=A0A2S4PY76_9PEZI|nr:hypothetical protein EPUL_001137 [Erysiphe pulchra]